MTEYLDPNEIDIEAEYIDPSQLDMGGSSGSSSSGSKPQDPTLPNLGGTENKIAGRSDLLSQVMDKAKGDMLQAFTPNPPENIKNALQTIAGLSQRGEAMVANPLMKLQRGDSSGLLDSVMQGASGQRQGQLGDLIRTTGVGGDYNEALASTTGFMALMGIDKFVGSPLQNTTKGIAKGIFKGVKPTLTEMGQAVDDAVKNKTGFLDDVRSAFYDAKGDAVDKYGLGLEELAKNNPTTKVDLTPAINQIKQEIAYNPKLENAINRVPYLKNIMDNPKIASNMGIKETQTLVNDLQSKVASGKLKGIGVRPDDIPLLDAVHDIKVQMVNSFPDIADLRKGYGETVNAFNLVRNKLKIGNLEKAVQDKFGDVEVQQSVQKLLKDYPQIISRMKNYHSIRTAGKVGAGVVGIGTADALIRKVLGR